MGFVVKQTSSPRKRKITDNGLASRPKILLIKSRKEVPRGASNEEVGRENDVNDVICVSAIHSPKDN